MAKFESMTLAEYLRLRRYSLSFQQNYVLPMCAAVWSVPNAQVRAPHFSPGYTHEMPNAQVRAPYFSPGYTHEMPQVVHVCVLLSGASLTPR